MIKEVVVAAAAAAAAAGHLDEEMSTVRLFRLPALCPKVDPRLNWGDAIVVPSTTGV